jgi:Icc-related predicted phosphoesterase
VNQKKLLCLSDVEVPAVYNSRIRERFPGLDAVISCGDLPWAYLEFVVSMLDLPLYYVQGNHVFDIEDDEGEVRHHPYGAVNLHRQVIYDPQLDLILAGIEGSLRYNWRGYQYTQRQMWQMVFGLVPQLLFNKMRYGRYLDILVTHAAPTGIHDEDDPAHRGVDAFRWLIENFSPKLHLHGHIHLYNPLKAHETMHGHTRVINCYGHREISLDSTQSSESV